MIMKMFSITIFITLTCGVLGVASCNNGVDESFYFNGNITLVDKFQKEVSLPSSKVYLEDIYDDRMIYCDSFLLFESHKYSDYWFYAFDLKTGKHVASFCPKGQSPDEYLFALEFGQILKSGGNSKIWVNDFYNKSTLINITQSIRSGQTICDSTISMHWNKYFEYPPTSLFFLNNGGIIGSHQCQNTFQEKGYQPRSYYLYKDSLENEISHYILYNHPIINKLEPMFPFMLYFLSRDCMKPDQTKIVMAMNRVGQINIMDIKTGKLKGFRQSNSLTFQDLKGPTDKLRNYYLNVCVNDKYILAPYVDVSLEHRENPDSILLSSCIHVFDWEGEPLYKINLKEKIYNITLDDRNHILYGMDRSNNIYSYDVSFIK